jgi:hypothetical protein
MRPNDIYGQPIVMGQWYWATNRTGQTVGTGKFAATISRPDDITFFINGAGYLPESFQAFTPAIEPKQSMKPLCDHAVSAAARLARLRPFEAVIVPQRLDDACVQAIMVIRQLVDAIEK